MTSPPSTIAVSSMTTSGGCASVADAAGNLLFYTNGGTIWNRLHNVMANGSGISGDIAAVQNCVILKQPGNSNLYYLFTNNSSGSANGPAGLFYSIVDISLAAGNGSVITKNVQLTSNALISGIGATKKCNGVDYWITVHPSALGSYYTFQLTGAGASATPIISNIGIVTPAVAGGGYYSMRFSPNGKKLAVPILNQVDLMDFDNVTGLLSNVVTLTPSIVSNCTGIEFSPDGSKLYSAQLAHGIVQYNLCQTNTMAIQSSSIIIAPYNLYFQNLQAASDGKIYACCSLNNFLAVINAPNSLGTACNFTFNAVPLSTGLWNTLLPNFATTYFYQKPPVPPFTYTSSMALGCYGAQFNALLPTFCAASSNSVTGLSWNFGDPGAGAANTSFVSNPTHFYPSNGNYTVQLVLYYTCGIANDTLSQVININHNCLSTTSNSITCASLGSATITNAVGGGPFTFTWLPSNQTGSVAINMQPGTHTVVTTDLSNNYTYSSTVFFAPLTPLTANISSSGTVSCFAGNNGSGSITNISGGSPIQNILWNSGSQTTSIASPTNLSAGNWTVTVTDALTACQVTSVLAITQPPPLSPTLTISTPTICAGSNAILSATNSGGTPAYTFTFVNGPVSFSSTVTESLVGTHVYTVQSTDANNCLSSATVSLDVITNPNLIVPSVSICPTNPAVFTATGATTYTWLPPSANGSFTASAASSTATITFSDSPLSNTQYTIIGSDLGCTSTTTTSAFIFASPTPIISSNSPKCEGSTAVLSVSGGTAAVWSGPNIFSSSALSNTVSNLSLANAGLYLTTITSIDGCTASATSSFVVNPTPTVSAAGSTVCTTQTMSLFANSFSGSSYQWFGLNNYSSIVQNPTLVNPSLNRTGSYTVIVTAPTSCTNLAVAQVSVTSPPSLSIALSSNSLCAQAFNGSPNTITLTSSGANTYTLYTPNLLGSSTPIAPSASLFATPPFSSTLAAGIATLQGSNGVCTNTSSFVFTVVPNPTVGINSFTPVICAGKNFTYTSNGANSYVWSATTPNYTTYSNGGVAVAHPSINAVFSVYGSSLGCQSALVSSSITVYPLPTITLSALSSSICLNDKTNLSVSGTGTSFQWLPANGLNTYTSSNVIHTAQSNMVYTVIASVNNCTAAATTSIHVWPLPIASITSTGNNVCLHDNITLIGDGGVQYNWFGPGKIALAGQSVSIKAWSPTVGGTYTLVVTDANACKNFTTTNINIIPLPDGYIKNLKEDLCAPYCTTYNFEGFNSKNISSTWVVNSSTVVSNVFSTCFNQAGTYTLQGKLLDNATSCKSELSYIVNVHQKPSADFLFVPKTPIENLDEVEFTNTSSGDGLLSYHWYFNDNKGFSTTNKNTSYLYSEPGDYRVVLVTKNNFNCADTILKTIHVEPDFALYVPNTFTPNDDNRNDLFLASVRSSKLFDLKIYDRWGAEIFHSKSPQDGWDGSFKGEACKQDTYTWVIELSTVGGERVVKTGTVLLLR